jgi:hypothetical protein
MVLKSNHVVDQGGTLSRIDRGTDAKVERARTRASSDSSRTSYISRLRAGTSRRNIAFLTLLFTLAAAAVAIAAPGGTVSNVTPGMGDPGLAKVGPVNPDTGFPEWYKDKSGVTLEPCLDVKDPLCIMGDVPNPDAPLNLDNADPAKNNFPDEFFYQSMSSGLDNLGSPDAQGKLGRATAVLSLEGAFATGVKPGDQMVFARTRFKVDGGLQPQTKYRVVSPYGSEDIETDAQEDNFFVTEDIGITPGGFSEALAGRIAPFMRWTPDPANPLPAGYVGDPNIDHAITGSPQNTNYFAVIGPGVGANLDPTTQTPCPQSVLDKGAGLGFNVTANDCVWTSLFSLMGKIASKSGVDITGATYARNAAGHTTLDVTGESQATTPAQNIVVQDANAARRATAARLIPTTNLLTQDGNFYAHITVPDRTPSFPNSTENKISVANYSDFPRTEKTATPVDAITGTATFDTTLDGTGKGNLTVTAQSSDQLADAGGPLAHLTIEDVIDPATGQKTVLAPSGGSPVTNTKTVALSAPPATVTVKSSQGGDVKLPVTFNGPDTPIANLHADAGKDLQVTRSKAGVKLAGTSSSGNIATYAWTGPFAVTLQDTDADPSTPDVKVVGTDPAPAANGGALTDASKETATITAPSVDGDYGYHLKIAGDAGPDGNATAEDDMVVTVGAAGTGGVIDLLTAGKARFQASAQRLVIDGTATVRSGDIDMWFSRTIQPGSAPDAVAHIDPVDGSWAYDTARGGQPAIPACSCVSYISTNGNPGSADIGGDAEVAAGTAHEVWNNITIDNTALGGGGGGGGGGGAVPPPPPAPVAAAAAGAIPLVGRAAPAATVGLARLVAPATVTAAAVGGAGVPVTVTIPKGATVLRLRVLTTANKALFSTFKKVKGGTKVKVKIKSAKLRKQIRAGKRYVIEARAGKAKNRLGKATRTVIRVRA